ncbi:MAG: hypothetical protein SGCHY_005070 [Lobulomycetales sp.]
MQRALRKSLGIRREGKNKWERRVPLTPAAVKRLVSEYSVPVYVQPSSKRVFPDRDYADAGAILTEDLSSADIIMGVKEVASADLLPKKTYIFFSHTHKGQAANMPMLRKALDLKIRLMDYELLTDENYRRLVAFGSFAGYAGMIDGLNGFGQRLLSKGFGTPFLNIGMAYKYPSLHDAKLDLFKVGLDIKSGLSPELGPLTFTFIGDGNVSQGAQHMLSCLPVEMVKANDLAEISQMKVEKNDRVYGCVATLEDYIVRKSDKEPLLRKDRDTYYSNPELFESKFHEKIAPYSSMIVNGILWDPRYPRLLTKEQIKAVYSGGNDFRLTTVADISCDIDGSIEFTSHATSIDAPFFVYDPTTDVESYDAQAKGIQVMSIDNLPCELALESSEFFSTALFPHVVKMIENRFQSDPVLARSIITNPDGTLADAHKSLQEALDKSVSEKRSSEKSVLVLGSGYVSSPLVDYLLKHTGVTVTVASNNLEEATRVASSDKSGSRVHPCLLNVSDSNEMDAIVSRHDLVVSLVPATMHASVAKLCIKHRKDMVTASYISPAMAELHEAAKAAGITILNELGLDPGIDHLTAMQFFDAVKARGDGSRIDRFVSWCGGLPAPEASDNPVGYKFSWSPRYVSVFQSSCRGVLLAGMNDALYVKESRRKSVPGEALFRDVIQVDSGFRGFALEGLPNRNSVAYADTYGIGPIENLKDMFRGTLRYAGTCELLDAFKSIGFFSTAEREDIARGDLEWRELFASILNMDVKADNGKEAYLSAIADSLSKSAGAEHMSEEAVKRVAVRLLDAMSWLGALDQGKKVLLDPGAPPSVLDSFCHLLQLHCQYGAGERDMILMHHEFGVELADGGSETHTSTLVAYGDPEGYSAMAKTVGLPAAMGVDLILSGQIEKGRGVIAPITPDIYEPILARLEDEGIVFQEKRLN